MLKVYIKNLTNGFSNDTVGTVIGIPFILLPNTVTYSHWTELVYFYLLYPVSSRNVEPRERWELRHSI